MIPALSQLSDPAHLLWQCGQLSGTKFAMIPRLDIAPGIDAKIAQWLQRLKATRFGGDIETTLAARIAVATDNSIYEVMPQAVLFPRSCADVAAIMRMLGEPAAGDVQIVPRGGGTGTNGQALSSGVVVDLSRHMRGIVSIDVSSRTVEVEPGVVLDDLNRALAPHGLFFAPSLSPSDRATLGGMVATNACGKGSRVYGRTVDHVCELDVILVDGTEATLREMDMADAQQRARKCDTFGRIIRDVLQVLEASKELIASRWPVMPRSPSGYCLPRVVSADGKRFNLVPLFCGSEGTLGIVVRARLNLCPIPKHKRLLVLRYAQFDDALASAEMLVEANPAAIETIDDNILQLVRADILWHKVEHLLQDDGRTRAINLVEFTGNDAEQVERKLQRLQDSLSLHAGEPGAPIATSCHIAADDIAAMWEVRKKGVGLLGKMKGQRRPIPFVEDTAVPPARLAEYVREFRQLLESEGLRYGIFGHVDAGCLHVRPALDMRDPEDARRLRRISDQVSMMVKRYGGVLWGEHGTGFRSEYLPNYFGNELFEAMCRIKTAFDPEGRLNRGKLALAQGRGHVLTNIESSHRAQLDSAIAPDAQKHFPQALYCNGNGQCFNSDPNTVMCPSSKITHNRVHSPKGRAMMLRQWLRHMKAHGHDVAQTLERRLYPPDFAPHSLLERWSHSFATAREYDFSHEVYEAFDGCLSCKACSTQCPIEVDIPRVKAEFLSLYHERYARPVRDYLMAALEPLLGAFGRFPRLLNWMLHNPIVAWIMRRFVGLVDLPRLGQLDRDSARTMRKYRYFSVTELESLAIKDRARTVLVLQDAFTTFFEPHIVLAAAKLIERLGYHPLLVPYFPNGKALHIKGFMRSFSALAKCNAARISRLAALGIDIVGLEPAVTLTYREEYRHVLSSQTTELRVLLVHEWLMGKLPELAALRSPGDDFLPPPRKFTYFGHCTEQTAHPLTTKHWQEIFAALGVELSPANVGCCGMCGVFGHEQTHYPESRGIFELSWQPRLESAKEKKETIVVAGFSCRHQVHRLIKRESKHPVVALLESMPDPDLTSG